MSEPSPSGSSTSWKIILGAIVLLCLPVAAFYLLSPILSTPHPVAECLIEPYSGPFETYKQVHEEDWDAAVAAYKQEEFQEAGKLLRELQSKTQLKPQQKLLQGLCFLYQDNPKPAQAADLLLALSKENKNYFYVAEWYASLAYYLSDQRSVAHELWRKMVEDNDHPFSVSAKNILEEVPAQEES